VFGDNGAEAIRYIIELYPLWEIIMGKKSPPVVWEEKK